MKRFAWLCLLVSPLACVDRALDADGTISIGPGSGDLGGADLRDAGPVDLYTPPQRGVLCDGKQCNDQQVCCPLSGVGGFQCVSPTAMGGGCPFGPGYRCDGPEDCTMGRRCVGTFGNPGMSQITETRCRMNANGNEAVICHVRSDCRPGEDCMPVSSTQVGAPVLGVCVAPD